MRGHALARPCGIGRVRSHPGEEPHVAPSVRLTGRRSLRQPATWDGHRPPDRGERFLAARTTSLIAGVCRGERDASEREATASEPARPPWSTCPAPSPPTIATTRPPIRQAGDEPDVQDPRSEPAADAARRLEPDVGGPTTPRIRAPIAAATLARLRCGPGPDTLLERPDAVQRACVFIQKRNIVAAAPAGSRAASTCPQMIDLARSPDDTRPRPVRMASGLPCFNINRTTNTMNSNSGAGIEEEAFHGSPRQGTPPRSAGGNSSSHRRR